MSTCFEPITPVKLSWRNGWPYSQQFEDIYFSNEGVEESTYVYLHGNQLIKRWGQLKSDETFVIVELGFGTGLNLLLAIQHFLIHAPSKAHLHYFALEKYPLTFEDLSQCLSLWPNLSQESQLLLSVYPALLTPGYHCCKLDNSRITLHLLLGDADESLRGLLHSNSASLEPLLRSWHVDAWFLDGFAPAKNPDMWSKHLFSSMALLSKPNTTLATFSAAGFVRRGLIEAGFEIQKMNGFGHKRDMLVGSFVEIKPSYCTRYTPWHISELPSYQTKKAIVVGAGLAGCFTAYELAQRGWQVTLIDEASAVAKRASANPKAVLYPNLSIYRAPLTQWMLHAFIYAKQCYQPWLDRGLFEGELKGILQLATDDKTCRYLSSLTEWLNHYPQLGRLVTSEEATALSGISLLHPGLFIPFAGWINAQQLCEFLSQCSGIDCVLDETISELRPTENGWKVNKYEAEVVVLATGYQANQWLETNFLSLTPFKGQLTAIEGFTEIQNLKLPICAKGHLLPLDKGIHWMGATYQQGVVNTLCEKTDDETNLKLVASLAASNDLPQVVNHWADVRVATRDYMPVVGPVPKSELFSNIFSVLALNRKQFVSSPGPYHSGLYLCSGFGSRGLTTIPWSANYLANIISGTPCGISREMAQSVSPARFLIQKIAQSKR